MSCTAEIRTKIALAKEDFKRKRRLLCGTPEKVLPKRLVNVIIGLCYYTGWKIGR